MIPPQDIQAEEALLGSILIDNTVMDDLEMVPEDFYVDFHRRVFEAMVQMRSDDHAIDVVTIYGTLSKAGDFSEPTRLNDLLNKVPTSANFQAYAKKIKDKAIMRKIMIVGQEMIQAASSGESPRNLLDDFEEKVLSIGDNERSSDFVPLQENMTRHLVELEKTVKTEEKPGIMTGFNCLDHKLNGLHGGDLIVLAARPGMGKTTLAMNILSNVAEDGHGGGFLSLEMTEESLRTRMICSRAKVDSSKVRGGSLSETELEAYIYTAKQMKGLKIFINDDPRTSLLRLKSSARRLKRQQGVKLLVVDYLQLMTAGEKIDGRVNEVSHISRQMKLLAKALDIPIILLSQLNRTSDKEKKRRPRLSDLRDSGAIEQDADIVGFLYMDDENTTETEMITAKNRAGSTGVDKLDFEKIFNRFTEER